MRRVKYTQYKLGKVVGQTEANFLQFSTMYDIMPEGTGQYPVAVLELDSGQVIVVPAGDIAFIKQETKRDPAEESIFKSDMK